MPRPLTVRAARKMAAARKTHGAGAGRFRKPTACPKCGAPCDSAPHALAHW